MDQTISHIESQVSTMINIYLLLRKKKDRRGIFNFEKSYYYSRNSWKFSTCHCFCYPVPVSLFSDFLVCTHFKKIKLSEYIITDNSAFQTSDVILAVNLFFFVLLSLPQRHNFMSLLAVICVLLSLSLVLLASIYKIS